MTGSPTHILKIYVKVFHSLTPLFWENWNQIQEKVAKLPKRVRGKVVGS